MASIQSNTRIPGRSGIFRHRAVGIRQRFANEANSEDVSEVGLPHSSDEDDESRWSEGGNKSAFSGRETRITQEVMKAWNMN